MGGKKLKEKPNESWTMDHRRVANRSKGRH